MRHILVDDGEWEMSEDVADDLVLRGIIRKHKHLFSLDNVDTLYEVTGRYSHLQTQDLDALTNGIEVADEVLDLGVDSILDALIGIVADLSNVLQTVSNGRYRVVLWDRDSGRNGNYVYPEEVR